jgi:hypothetical protein
MGSRPQAGGGASAHAVSRRSLLAGASAVALPVRPATVVLDPPAAGSPGPEPGHLFRSWLAIDSRIERLQTRWARLESWLIQNHNWCELSAPEQRALPWARELRDIEGCLDLLFEQRQALLDRLPAEGARELPELADRLAVVERLVPPDENREAHAIVCGVRRDLQALIAAGGARAYECALARPS